MPNDNKIVDAEIDRIMKAAFAAGHFPRVNFHEGTEPGVRTVSFNLWELGDVRNAYRHCMHRMLKDRGYPMGIYEKLRSAAWQKLIKDLADQMTVAGTDDVKEGQEMLAKGLFGHGPREGTIIEEPDKEQHIFTMSLRETNGHYADIGSGYMWELWAVKIGDVWHPYDTNAEEREYEKEVDKAMRG